MKSILKEKDCITNDCNNSEIENYFTSLSTIIENEKKIETVALINKEIDRLKSICDSREFHLKVKCAKREFIKSCKAKSDENSAKEF